MYNAHRSLAEIVAAVPFDVRSSFVAFVTTGELDDTLASRADRDVGLQLLLDEALQVSIDEVRAALSPPSDDPTSSVALRILMSTRVDQTSLPSWNAYVAQLEHEMRASVGELNLAATLRSIATQFARAAAEAEVRQVFEARVSDLAATSPARR